MRPLSLLRSPTATLAAAGLAAAVVFAGAGREPAAKSMAKPPAPPTPTIAHERYQLDNGLEVILHPDPSMPLVAVNVWYHVGSGHEVPGKSGFAHLFEHMLFQGSKHVGSDRHFDLLKLAGASEINGTTNSDRTNYYEVLPAHQLELALWMESDRMAHLLPLLTQESLDNQIEVVRNERRQRYDNVPYGKTGFEVAKALYPEGHPYRYLTIGRHEDLEGASLTDVVDFFRTWYVPANATLCVAGAFDPATIKESIYTWFGTLPSSTKPQVVPVPAPRAKAAVVAVTDDFAKLRRLDYAWLSPAMMTPGDAELDLLADALTREGTGRLYRILVHEKKLAQSVSAFQWGKTFNGEFRLSIELRTGADAAEVGRIVADELARLAREPLGGDELARAVTAVEAAAVRGLEPLLARADQLQTYNHYLGTPDGLATDLARYRGATAEGIRDVVANTLLATRQVLVVTSPKEAP